MMARSANGSWTPTELSSGGSANATGVIATFVIRMLSVVIRVAACRPCRAGRGGSAAPPFRVSCGIFTQMTANVFDITKTVKRAYKYRFYPTPEQAGELTRTFGCVRKVWTLALQARTTAWHQRHEHVSYLQCSAMLTQWK